MTDRKKQYLFENGSQVPAFVELGIFDSNFNLIKAMTPKFIQINNFMGKIDEVFKEMTSTKEKPFQIIDFGSGKAYLTFFLYHYFKNNKNRNVKITGYDIKADVVENCNALAKKYAYENLKFEVSDAKQKLPKPAFLDMVVALHACDTLTDHAIAFAIENKAKYIFSVPCCQHELQQQIKSADKDFDIFMKHGLIKERFSALLTDAVRISLLEDAGYKVDVLEVAGFDVTPKNLMIRAVRKDSKWGVKEDKGIGRSVLEKHDLKQKLAELLIKG